MARHKGWHGTVALRDSDSANVAFGSRFDHSAMSVWMSGLPGSVHARGKFCEYTP